ncbi:hypothetical protein J1G42_10535 [Cellulomonas sp. zg-ZUI222]|uniref:Uncharacterized protein n=1 Tax=Cellulomonas wangleii TaxID=2816956 RepID=A0ABX8DAC6_9CELL|nr:MULTISPECIES: hypothetical protein [Cellulomonas]MBO0900593.1 hypothetical protein [Cellulomonas sp. zg-ZUI22]MBO0921261.1 hypothetical protein [Cellulomonas wangleii]MBO0925677.1 hypothetical protein [Cellulomonas wangleii]QVI63790.1 hypothetical protein KG103_08145 [Cellulomonas wangleii]
MTGPSGPTPDPGQRRPEPRVTTPTAPLPAGWAGPEPVAAAPHTTPAHTAPAPTAPPRRGRATTVLALLLVAVLATAGVVGWRLWETTVAWEESAADWEALARTHGDELAQVRAELEATAGELDATRAQLAAAQTRITELADEKAQLGDTTAAQQQLADYQARVSQAAGRVATSLATCVDGQERLIGYLQDAAAYDAADVARFRADVERVCGAAADANASLQSELSR